MNKIKYLIIVFLAGIIPMNYSVIEAQQNENIVNGFIESLVLVENQINISVIDNYDCKDRPLLRSIFYVYIFFIL